MKRTWKGKKLLPLDNPTHSELAPSLLQASPYPLLFATVGGSRAFGCASPTSDYDIHGVHLLSLETVLGLGGLEETVERKTEAADGTAMEIATHDLRKFVRLLLKGNGNVLEDLLSPLVVLSSPIHVELQALGQGCITKQQALHYRGMAQNQQRRMKAENLKQFLHQYRCFLMGMHLMQTGQLVLDLPLLAEAAHLPVVTELITWKQQGFDFVPDEACADHCTRELGALSAQLDQARIQSHLPDTVPPATRERLERLVVRTRLETMRPISENLAALG